MKTPRRPLLHSETLLFTIAEYSPQIFEIGGDATADS
jgi:hypothetical protein